MKKINNIKDLRDDLREAYVALSTDPSELAHTRELANVAGKIFTSVKLELMYAALTSRVPEIEFIESGMTFSGALKASNHTNIQ